MGRVQDAQNTVEAVKRGPVEIKIKTSVVLNIERRTAQRHGEKLGYFLMLTLCSGTSQKGIYLLYISETKGQKMVLFGLP